MDGFLQSGLLLIVCYAAATVPCVCKVLGESMGGR